MELTLNGRAPMREGLNHRVVAERPLGWSGRAASPRLIVMVALPALMLERLSPHVVAREALVLRLAKTDLDRICLAGAGAPGLILSPLVTPHFDAIDLGHALDRRGYRGRFLAVAESLPDAPLVRREMQDHLPRLNVGLLLLDGTPNLYLV